jgi:hypothetical protein
MGFCLLIMISDLKQALVVLGADLKGSDIVQEAILEAEVAHNAKEFFSQPQNQI